jgi:hypothetical protein
VSTNPSSPVFTSASEVLAACKTVGYETRNDTSGLGEKRFYVWLPDSDSEAATTFWSEQQFVNWGNAHFARLAVEAERRAAGWELLDAEEAPSGLWGWHFPCGTHEDAWRASGRPMPEDRVASQPVNTPAPARQSSRSRTDDSGWLSMVSAAMF